MPRSPGRRISFQDSSEELTSDLAAEIAADDVLAEAFDAAAKDGVLATEAMGSLLEQLLSCSLTDDQQKLVAQQKAELEIGDSLNKSQFEAIHAALRDEEAVEQPSPKHEMSDRMRKMVEELFSKLDVDKNARVTKEEATKFWGSNFAKVNATAMFNEVDTDKDGSVTHAEWLGFWDNVLNHGYTSHEVEEELELLMDGGSWVDFNDGRTT